MNRNVTNIVFWWLVLLGVIAALLIRNYVPPVPQPPTSTAVSTEFPKPSRTSTAVTTASPTPRASRTPQPTATTGPTAQPPTSTAVTTASPTPRASRTPQPSPQATETTGPNRVQRWEGSFLVFEGFMSSYSRNVTDAQLGFFLGEFPQAQRGISYIAVPNCDAVGMEGVMYVGDQALPVAVFDCAGPQAHRWMLNNDICCEVDFYTDAAHSVAHKWAAVYLEVK